MINLPRRHPDLGGASRSVLPVLSLALFGVLVGCRKAPSQVIVDDFGICQQPPGEFASSGCADITGQVVGLQGQPLAGVSVGPRPGADGGQFNTPFASTDGAGLFRIRLTRYAPPPTPDSATVWVSATVVPQPPQMAATVYDSAMVQVVIAPIGRVPPAARVTFRLPVP